MTLYDLSTDMPLDVLAEKYQAWLDRQGLPQACAYELSLSCLPDDSQREELAWFIDVWDEVQARADADANYPDN